MRAPKVKEPKATKSSPTRRSSRSAGFKRRKPIDDLDALVASGADAAEDTESKKPEAEGDFLPPDDTFSMPLGEEAPAEPIAEDAPSPVEVEEEPPEPEAVPPRRRPNLGSAVQATADEEEEPLKKPARSVASKSAGGGGNSKSTRRTKKGVSPIESVERSKSGRKQSLVKEKPSKSRRAEKKAPKNKPQDDFAPKGNPVVVAPEPTGSQIITLLEVIVGAALMFFGATQVGNILITNIVQGMLGG